MGLFDDEDPLKALARACGATDRSMAASEPSNVIPLRAPRANANAGSNPSRSAQPQVTADSEYLVTLAVGHHPSGRVWGITNPNIDFAAGNAKHFEPYSPLPVHLRPLLRTDVGPDEVGGRTNAILWARDDDNRRCVVFYVYIHSEVVTDDREGISWARDYIEGEYGPMADYILAPIFKRIGW